MIVVIDERTEVREAFVSLFARFGVAVVGSCADASQAWMLAAGLDEIKAVEAFLIGGCRDRVGLSRAIRSRSGAAVIAVNDQKSLADTLELFAAGCDDVVRKPVHAREILARITAIARRGKQLDDLPKAAGLKIFADGRDVEIDGLPLILPRRQRRILEYLAANRGCWMTKSQIFNCVYGVLGEDIAESVVECHVSKLRKRLRPRLGYDPITSQRHFGYRFACR